MTEESRPDSERSEEETQEKPEEMEPSSPLSPEQPLEEEVLDLTEYGTGSGQPQPDEVD